MLHQLVVILQVIKYVSPLSTNVSYPSLTLTHMHTQLPNNMLIHFRLNELHLTPNTIYWKNQILDLGMSDDVIQIFLEKNGYAKSGDPDQTPHSKASDLGLHCLFIILLGVSSPKCVEKPFLFSNCCPRLSSLIRAFSVCIYPTSSNIPCPSHTHCTEDLLTLVLLNKLRCHTHF